MESADWEKVKEAAEITVFDEAFISIDEAADRLDGFTALLEIAILLHSLRKQRYSA